MFAIYKYPAGYENGRLYYFGLSGRIIRSGWVDDGVYKGYWAWVLVNTEDTHYGKYFHNKDLKSRDYQSSNVIAQLGVCEEQNIQCFGFSSPKIRVGRGLIFLMGEIKEERVKKYKVVGYKTGQKFNYHPTQLNYLGFASLVIKNEIAIYYFTVNE